MHPEEEEWNKGRTGIKKSSVGINQSKSGIKLISLIFLWLSKLLKCIMADANLQEIKFRHLFSVTFSTDVDKNDDIKSYF